MAELQALARTLAQHIQVLTLQVAERAAVIDGLREELARSPATRVVRCGAHLTTALAESRAASSIEPRSEDWSVNSTPMSDRTNVSVRFSRAKFSAIGNIGRRQASRVS
ncbi:hypothetical protein ACVDG8_029145 [Mesorhizobium sp. ORM8.1]